MFELIRQVVSDPTTGLGSSKRMVLLLAGASLAAANIILTIAFCFGHDTTEALWAVNIPLSGLAGGSYTVTQMTKFKGTATYTPPKDH